MSKRENILMDQPQPTLSMHPKKFAMWLFLVSVLMIFASLTSAFIVRQAEGNWLDFELPVYFSVSTIIIIISSFTIQYAYWSAKRDNFENVRWTLLATIILGIVFLLLQYMGWTELVDMGVYFVGNPSGSFVYVISGLHGAHIISAILYVGIVFYNALKLNIHSKNLTQIEMCITFWHFLGGLWLYLFIFLLLNR